MKRKKTIIGLCTLLTISFFMTGCGREIEVKNGSKVAVSIDGEKFTATEYYNEIKEDNIAKLIEMIDTSLLENKYKEKDSEEDEQVKKQIEQIKSYYGSDDSTYKSVLQSYFGVENEKELETKLRLEYKRNKAVEDYIKENLTDKEIEKYYNENIYGEAKASHILITADVSSTATDEEKEEAEQKALKKAQDIIKKLNEGEDFAKLAKKNSKDEATASNGGDLGYFELDEMVEEFSEAVKTLKVNEYTKEPVKTQYGYHIILKTDEKEKKELKDVEEKVKEALKEQKMNESATIYYETLIKVREKENIKWNDTVLEKAYNEYMDKLIENVQSTN